MIDTQLTDWPCAVYPISVHAVGMDRQCSATLDVLRLLMLAYMLIPLNHVTWFV